MAGGKGNETVFSAMGLRGPEDPLKSHIEYASYSTSEGWACGTFILSTSSHRVRAAIRVLSSVSGHQEKKLMLLHRIPEQHSK